LPSSRAAHCPREAWAGNHKAHLSVAAWYCWCFDLETAVDKLRTGIKSFNESKGIENTETNGYHETITIFWATIVFKFIKEFGSDHPFEDIASAVVSAFATKRHLYFEYYSFDIFHSKEARKTWIKPDLRPFDP
jgi:hypothetical protein